MYQLIAVILFLDTFAVNAKDPHKAAHHTAALWGSFVSQKNCRSLQE